VHDIVQLPEARQKLPGDVGVELSGRWLLIKSARQFPTDVLQPGLRLRTWPVDLRVGRLLANQARHAQPR